MMCNVIVSVKDSVFSNCFLRYEFANVRVFKEKFMGFIGSAIYVIRLSSNYCDVTQRHNGVIINTCIYMASCTTIAPKV